MASALQFYQVDAFTETPLRGNPAGVVLDADGLTGAQMQAIARELNNSETAFLSAARGAGRRARSGEVPGVVNGPRKRHRRTRR
jgi:predicted PhzF superfamily epimerase YddE/YHI9